MDSPSAVLTAKQDETMTEEEIDHMTDKEKDIFHEGFSDGFKVGAVMVGILFTVLAIAITILYFSRDN